MTQFLGAMLTSSDKSEEETRHLIVAALLEEAMNICKTKDNISFFQAKPILRAAQIILQEERMKYVADLTEENVMIAKSIQGAEKVIGLLLDRKEEI